MSLKVLSIVILCVVAYPVEGKTAYRGVCLFSVDCETDLRCDRTYTTCSRGTCECETGKMHNVAGKCGSLLGGTCDVDTDCSVDGGHCNTANRKCECAIATPTKATYKFCVCANELQMSDSCTANQQYYYITKDDMKGIAVYTNTTPGPCGCPEDHYKQQNKCFRRPGNLIERSECSLTASRQCVEGLDCAQCGGESQPTCRKAFGGQGQGATIFKNLSTESNPDKSGPDTRTTEVEGATRASECMHTSRAVVSVIVIGLLLSVSTMM